MKRRTAIPSLSELGARERARALERRTSQLRRSLEQRQKAGDRDGVALALTWLEAEGIPRQPAPLSQRLLADPDPATETSCDSAWLHLARAGLLGPRPDDLVTSTLRTVLAAARDGECS